MLTLLYGIYLLAFAGMWLLAFDISISQWVFYTVQTALMVVVYAMSYFVLGQASVPVGEKGRVKYQRSPLLETNKQEYLDKILTFMHEKRPYLQPDLTINQFAKSIGSNRFYISQVINEQLGQSFPDFINTYRIKEAKRLLTDPQKSHYSILGIAYEAGFNSKTTFNTTFKKLTSLSPTQYLKSLNKDVPFDQSEQ